MSRLFWLIALVLTLSFTNLARAQEAEPDLENTEEPAQIVPSDSNNLTTADAYREAERAKRKKVCDCYFTPDVSYRERRSTFGGFVGVQAGTYAPTNYQPDFSTQSFKDYYGQGTSPLVELVFGAKLNVPVGSIGVQVQGGYYSARKESTNAELLLQPVMVGGILALDAILPEPVIVPYGIAGAYTVIYSEKAGGLKVSGNSPVAPFIAGGVMFQLNWIDKDSADDAYQDYGLENTFLYAEARQFLAGSGTVPNMATDVHYAGGLRVEF